MTEEDAMRNGGLAWAMTSAAVFGTSGALATPLLHAGWSAGGAVIARLLLAAVLLTPLAVVQLRGRWSTLRAGLRPVLGYGLLALAGCQWCYFNAIEHLSVGVALLLEYSGVLLVVVWTWLRHGRRPGRRTLAGGVLALAGLCLVLDVFGDAHVDAVGVMWGIAAAVGLAFYYVVSSQDSSSRGGDALPPVALAWAGMWVGTAALTIGALAGAVPFAAAVRDVTIRGHAVSVAVPVLGVALLATAVAYVAGIAGARLLGARVASFVGLAEVLFAILWAWVLLAQVPTAFQAAGGVLVLAGIVLVRAESDPAAEPLPEPAEPVII